MYCNKCEHEQDKSRLIYCTKEIRGLNYYNYSQISSHVAPGFSARHITVIVGGAELDPGDTLCAGPGHPALLQDGRHPGRFSSLPLPKKDKE
jgi:hypothetical protein